MFAIGMVWFHTDLNYVKEQSMIEKQKKKKCGTHQWLVLQPKGWQKSQVAVQDCPVRAGHRPAHVGWQLPQKLGIFHHYFPLQLLLKDKNSDDW